MSRESFPPMVSGNTKSRKAVLVQIDWTSVLFQRRHSMRTLVILPLIVWVLVSTESFAQVAPETMKRAASQAADLQFPTEASMPSVGMGIFKPDGAGPFPALVLLHQCAGLLARAKNPNLSMLDWAKESVARGYVAFLLDSLSQRDAKALKWEVGSENFFDCDSSYLIEPPSRFAFVKRNSSIDREGKMYRESFPIQDDCKHSSGDGLNCVHD